METGKSEKTTSVTRGWMSGDKPHFRKDLPLVLPLIHLCSLGPRSNSTKFTHQLSWLVMGSFRYSDWKEGDNSTQGATTPIEGQE